MLLSLMLATQITCNYSFQGAPFATVQVGLYDNGMPESSAMINQPGGPAHKESFTPDPLANGEFLHAWISKESSENSIEMIIYNPPRAEGQSVLINHHIPIGQEVWGSCTGVPFGYLTR